MFRRWLMWVDGFASMTKEAIGSPSRRAQTRARIAGQLDTFCTR